MNEVFDDIDPEYLDRDTDADGEYSDDGLGLDELEDIQKEYVEFGDEEPDYAGDDQGNDEEAPLPHDVGIDPFCLGIAAGYGYEEGREERRRGERQKKKRG